ncbi:hypothetical protein PLESTB_000196300 [Pleodorina starrii]|uniref:Protein kinase domain-containing protein n=1 Tax=Pleodorina starrii TaxID=330485 RepID=A0A9W6BCH5_9CHLO|nr:hypothetical protein PLESTM_000335500 [Pleodorina starrii]GLC49220.1 hypothetical protein PLESTB_000195800 [Pleodorina starrii]GLC49224.1 hypothetical protein PLESTB_000196200 [Pleodorina starrii]GLC49225.1 hypothetical protein PLESTB_000196300 [Pleodorina starrii]GLC73523.1 hypothetical protein PLESTF_001386800 [Pleodorina starrii]
MSEDHTHPPGPGRPRALTSRSALKHGEGSFRGLFGGLSRTGDRPAVPQPLHQEGPRTAFYLDEEMNAARQAVKQLDKAVSGAVSFREAATKLLTEALRALSRLEQAMDNKEAAAELIGIACDIKCAAKRGITLVDVYGKYSTAVKIMTLFLRSYIHAKFDKQAELLRKLNPPLPRGGAAAAAGGATAGGGGGGGGAPPPQGAPMLPVSPSQQQQQQQQQFQQQHQPLAITAMSNAQSMASTLSGGSLGTAPDAAAAPPPPPPPQAAAAAGPGGAKPLGRTSHGASLVPAPPPASGPLVGKALSTCRHDKVLALAYVPAASSDYVCIWWSAGQRLEHYADATQATTAFQQAFAVTAVAVDEEGSVWTGHIKGQVRLRRKQPSWEEAEVKEFSAPIRVITIDEAGRAWVGDEAGRIKVLTHVHVDGAGAGPRSGGTLEVRASLQRSPALLAKLKGGQSASLFGKRHIGNSGTSGQPSAAAVFAAATNTVAAAAAAATNTVAAAAAAVTQTAMAAGPVGSPGGAAAAAAAGAGTVAAASTSTADKGGSNHPQPQPPAHSHAGTGTGTMEGPVRCIFVRGGRVWAGGGRGSAWLQLWDAETFQDIDVFDCGAFGPCHAMAPLRWPSSSSSGPGPGYHHPALNNPPQHQQQHRHTQSDATRAPGPAPAPCGGSWRLLTGHENGQLLLWHPEHRVLAPLLRIGDPGSPCRGIAAFEAYNLVVTGHTAGYLHLFIQPGAETGLPPGSESACPQSLGTHRPKMATVQAHKSRLERMTCGATSCVTASFMNTIRLWHAADLAQEAHRLGLTLTHTPSYNSLLAVDPSQPGAPGSHYHSNASSHQYTRDSAKCLMSPEMGTGGGGGGSSAAGESSCHHGRQGSKDSMDVFASAQTQPSSGTTTATGPLTADTLPGGASASQAGPSASGASFPHFQTIDYSELKTTKVIGAGAYGEVLLADWMGSEVAVKRLFAVQRMDDKEYAALMNEVTLLGSLSHPNIVRFLAMCVEPPCIVMQYYSHGSLFNMLRNAAKGRAAKEMTWSKRLEMLRDVAAGMQYLHSRKPPVIHGDLRSPNLLLDLTIERERPRFHVKIADFGLARMATGATGSVMVSKMTNPRWLAPEVMKNSSVGKAADVYSFAIIMWEMLTWQQPYQDMMSVQVIYSMANGGARPELPPDSELPGSPGVSLPAYRQLMERCWQADAEARPSFREIVDVFQDMLRVEAENVRQRRPQPPQPQGQGLPRPSTALPQPQQQQQAAPGSGSPSDAGSHVPSPPPGSGGACGDVGAAAAEAAAGGTVSAPGSGDSGSGAAAPPATAAVAAVAAAARRAAAAGVSSPFMVAPSPASVEPQASQAAAVASDGGAHAPHGHQQYGSVLPLYGMSPILEETSSVSAARSSAGGAALGGAAATTTAAAAAAALGAGGAATAVAVVAAAPPLQQPHQQAAPQAQPHPHVHFAPKISSPFSQCAADGGATASAPTASSSSCPASPTVSTRARAGAASPALARGGAQPIAPSSASSTESGAVHAASGGSNTMGAPSTAASSRQSSTSTSGRTIGTAAAAGSKAMAAASPEPSAGSTTPRRDGGPAGVIGGAVPAAAGADGGGGDGATAAAAAPITTVQSAAAPLPESNSVPLVAVRSITSLSPFASMPAAQLGELDAAAPHLAALAGPGLLGGVGLAGAAATTGHARPAAAPPSPRQSGTPRGVAAGAGGRGAGAGASAAALSGHAGSTQVAAAAAPVPGARGRIPGPSVGPGPTAKDGGSSGGGGGGGGTPLGTPRSGGAVSHLQPETPPYRGPPATASPGSRGAATGCGSRAGSIAGVAAAAGGTPGRSTSGEEPPSGGASRGPGSASSTPRGDSTARPVSVCSHLSEAAVRLSRSAAHAHVDGHDDAVAGGGRSGHRRTPSGGNVVPGHHAQLGLGRAREQLASATAAAQNGQKTAAASTAGESQPHSRPPFHAVRSGGEAASPRMSAPNAASTAAAEPRAGAAASRRNFAGPPSVDLAASPSAPASGHLSRLAAAACATAAAARPPASPRSYIPSGPGANSGGVSRIPSLASQGAAATQGSVSLLPAKTTTTSRSLDDGGMRRLGLCDEPPSSSPPPALASLQASPAVGGALAGAAGGGGGGGALAAGDAAWEEGLEGIHFSPGATQEDTRCFGQPGEHAQLSAAAASAASAEGGVYGRGGGGSASYAPPPSLPRIATSERRLPPQRAATRAGGSGGGGASPFATAAHASPSRLIDGEAEPGPEAEAGEAGIEPDARRSSCVGMAVTSPTAPDGARMESAWSSEPAAAAAASPPRPAAAAPASAAATAARSPFADMPAEPQLDGWWEDHHQDD